MTAAAVVDVVDLNVISHNQPFPGIHEYTMKIEAEVNLPSTNSVMMGDPEGVITNQTTGNNMGPYTLINVSGNQYESSVISIWSASPGDTLIANVTARWMTPGEGNKDSAPETLP